MSIPMQPGSSLPQAGETVPPIVDLPPPEQVAYPAVGDSLVQFQQLLPDALPPPGRRQKKSGQKVLPPELDIVGPSSNDAFRARLADSSAIVSPQALGFLPSSYWLNVDNTFGDLVMKFFQRKNNANCRFPHKLYNALAVVDQDPNMFNLFGVRWVTDQIFKVDKLIFGRLLGITSIDGGLFHRQGNFPSHRFAELTVAEVDQLKTQYDLSDVDMDRVRLMYHRDGMFRRGADEDSVTRCKWQT